MSHEFQATKMVLGKEGRRVYDSMSPEDKKAIDWLADRLREAYGKKKPKRKKRLARKGAPDRRPK